LILYFIEVGGGRKAVNRKEKYGATLNIHHLVGTGHPEEENIEYRTPNNEYRSEERRVEGRALVDFWDLGYGVELLWE
jgi:hypothetical protein